MVYDGTEAPARLPGRVGSYSGGGSLEGPREELGLADNPAGHLANGADADFEATDCVVDASFGAADYADNDFEAAD